MKRQQFLIFIAVLILMPLSVQAQDEYPNILFYDSVAGSPKVNIEDIAWLAGHWKGEAYGGIVEELWSPPFEGSMMGSFKLVADEMVQFYELETISEEDETLILRLRHFGPDLKAWEETDKTIDFKLVLMMKNKAFFNGLTIEKINADEINMYVIVDYEGKNREIKFAYKRVE